jgi:hypothetical protein
MSVFHEWLHDPGASSAISIALVAGTWAVAQFRPVARERRRETYEAMTSHYVELREARDAAVPRFPPLLFYAQAELAQSLSDSEAAGHVETLAEELDSWRRSDIAFTAAHEIVDSEVKFRALLWSVQTIKAWRREDALWLGDDCFPASTLIAAQDLAHDLNAFLFHYETGNYPARQTLGLLHRSLAVVSKVTEPVIWERSMEARWGRRVLRIGLAAQHFNDVTPIHSVSDLTWSPEGQPSRLIHPRARRSVLGASFVSHDSPLAPRFLAGVRLRTRSAYWYLVGLLAPPPKLAFVSYGGMRLRRHRRVENELAGLLKLACDSAREPLDFTWSLDSLKNEQRVLAHAERRRHGTLAWLWAGSSRRSPAELDGGP